MTLSRVVFSSASDEWRTPSQVLEVLNQEFSFDFDPCPLGSQTAFVEVWGRSVFVNPPYSDIRRFLDKAVFEIRSGRTSVAVFLVPSRTDTKWWHEVVIPLSREVRFIRGRLRFNGVKQNAPFPSCVIVFDQESVKKDEVRL